MAIEGNSRKRKLSSPESNPFKSPLMTQAGNPEDGKKKIYKLGTPIDDGHGWKALFVMPQHTEHTFANMVAAASPAHSHTPHRTITEPEKSFKQIRILGSGSFGIVDEIESTDSCLVPGNRYARKVFKSVGFAAMDSIRNELEIAKSFCHDHIVSVKMTYDIAGEKISKYTMVMEPVADCNLQEYMQWTIENNRHREAQERQNMQKWFGCLSSGLAYLHAKRIRHKDIKPSNILVKNTQVFYADFGLSKEFRDINETKTMGTPGNRTPVYSAPEVEASHPRGRKADVFSLGCVFMELLTVLAGHPLEDFRSWRGEPGRQAYHSNLHRLSVWATKIQEQLTVAFLRGVLLCTLDMLNHNPEIRPSSFQATKRAFDLLVSVPNLIETICTCMNPWEASGNCYLVLPSRASKRPRAGLGKYSFRKSIVPEVKNGVCQHCQRDYVDPFALLEHYASEHSDLFARVDGIFCPSPICDDEPRFDDYHALREHLRIFHNFDCKESSLESCEKSYLI